MSSIHKCSFPLCFILTPDAGNALTFSPGATVARDAVLYSQYPEDGIKVFNMSIKIFADTGSGLVALDTL
jgi:hypothetical protein